MENELVPKVRGGSSAAVSTSRDGAESRWHRVFHPICGSDPQTLAALLRSSGPPSGSGWLTLGAALVGVGLRLPFTVGERLWFAASRNRLARQISPIFIVGHMRSGTTHLHNLLAAGRQFNTVPPVLAGLPWEAHSLARLMRPLIEQRLPSHRLIDRMALQRDSPTEDELALANMSAVSWYHAIYFPRQFQARYRRGLLLDDVVPAERRRQRARLRHYIQKMAALDQARPLLVKNPAYCVRIDEIFELWPNARFIHIVRHPCDVYRSSRRALTRMLTALALQPWNERAVEQAVLEVYPIMMDRVLDSLEGLSPDRVATLRFEDLEADPIAALEAAYQRLSLPDFATASPHIDAYLASIRTYRPDRHCLADETVETILDRWKSIFIRLNYSTDRETSAGPLAGRGGIEIGNVASTSQ
jgi:hypothetical protein